MRTFLSILFLYFVVRMFPAFVQGFHYLVHDVNWVVNHLMNLYYSVGNLV